MKHPYEDLPARAFWKSGVAAFGPLALGDLSRPKFPIAGARIATAGSCFAQHIGAHLRERGFAFVDVEPAPDELAPAERPRFGYGLYSARYGNVYTARQLRQLFERAAGGFVPRETVWRRDGRCYDPFRPNIEPDGFASAEAVAASRRAHLGRVAGLLAATDVFCFTFGLTEAWIDRDDGAVFPSCPGVIAGDFDDARFAFHDFSHDEVLADVEALIAIARKANPAMRFLLTVSPVPLTATASGAHVLTATMHAKSVLRAVAGELADRHDFVDYFPAYEMIASAPARAVFFEPNLRSVSPQGVAHVMAAFFAAHAAASDAGSPAGAAKAPTAIR